MKNTRRLFLVIALMLLIINTTGCEVVKRGIKTIKSNVSGLNRTAEVYDYQGNLLKAYEGEFDIEENSSGTKVKFDINGKRIMIYNAIVIVEEKQEGGNRNGHTNND